MTIDVQVCPNLWRRLIQDITYSCVRADVESTARNTSLVNIKSNVTPTKNLIKDK